MVLSEKRLAESLGPERAKAYKIVVDNRNNIEDAIDELQTVTPKMVSTSKGGIEAILECNIVHMDLTIALVDTCELLCMEICEKDVEIKVLKDELAKLKSPPAFYTRLKVWLRNLVSF